MNKLEYIEYELEENANLRKKLKADADKKKKAYKTIREDFENSNVQNEIEKRKRFIEELQLKHKKENEEIKARQKKEREEAYNVYLEIKDSKDDLIKTSLEEMQAATKAYNEANERRKELRREKKRLRNIGEVNVTSHAIVQYLDRAKGVDVKSIRKEIQDERISEDKEKFDKIPDKIVVDFLVQKGKIDVEKIEKDILPADIKKILLSNELSGSSGTYTLKNGFRIVVVKGNIVTFLPIASKPKRFPKGKRKNGRSKRKIRKMKL